ncbi:MAG TPA: hypothetical protein VIR31_00755 [Nitrososphaeraceae archaeon]
MQTINPLEYKNRSYEELSAEFKLSVSRAVELVPLMYNRLTLIDNYSHKAAITRMYNDHRHLSGFSHRNIRRYLPLNNKAVPRRVRPSCPKNSFTKVKTALRLSNAKQQLDSSYIEEVLCENAILRFLNSFLQIKVRCLGEILREKEGELI